MGGTVGVVATGERDDHMLRGQLDNASEKEKKRSIVVVPSASQ